MYYYVGMLVLLVHFCAAVLCFVTQCFSSSFVVEGGEGPFVTSQYSAELAGSWSPMQLFCRVTQRSFPLHDETKMAVIESD